MKVFSRILFQSCDNPGQRFLREESTLKVCPSAWPVSSLSPGYPDTTRRWRPWHEGCQQRKGCTTFLGQKTVDRWSDNLPFKQQINDGSVVQTFLLKCKKAGTMSRLANIFFCWSSQAISYFQDQMPSTPPKSPRIHVT